jgi:hypothetical protein
MNRKLMLLPLLSLLLFTVPVVFASNMDVDVVDDMGHIHFHADGSFSGILDIVTQNPGMFDTDIDFTSLSPANFHFSGEQKLFGYTTDEVYCYAAAGGSSSASMNLRFDQSMYVVQLERHDTSRDFLSGSGMYYVGWGMGIQDSTGTSLTGCNVGLMGIGSGVLDSGQWFPTATGYYGWGGPNGWNAPDPPSYYTPVNTVSATGMGMFHQDANGPNSLTFNGWSGAGSANFDYYFSNGLSGQYSMTGK